MRRHPITNTISIAYTNGFAIGDPDPDGLAESVAQPEPVAYAEPEPESFAQPNAGPQHQPVDIDGQGREPWR